MHTHVPFMCLGLGPVAWKVYVSVYLFCCCISLISNWYPCLNWRNLLIVSEVVCAWRNAHTAMITSRSDDWNPVPTPPRLSVAQTPAVEKSFMGLERKFGVNPGTEWSKGRTHYHPKSIKDQTKSIKLSVLLVFMFSYLFMCSWGYWFSSVCLSVS